MRCSRLNVVELYAGTARSSQPFRSWKRCSIALLVDNDRLANKTYLHNFPGSPYLKHDIGRLTAHRIRTLAGGRVDILLGCPPCQGFSDTGTRDPEDPRNSHLARFGYLAETLEPLAVAMENVPLAAATPQFWAFVARMERAGYAWTAGIINAALYGSVQCRQRLVYIALRRDVRAEPRLPPPSHGGYRRYFSYRDRSMKILYGDRPAMLGEAPAPQRIRRMLPWDDDAVGRRNIPYLEEVLDGLPRIGSPAANSLCHRPWAHTRQQLQRMGAVPEGDRWHGGHDHYASSYGRLHRHGLARTITRYFANPGSGRFWHPTENRALTLREAARIQGFPDSFIFLPPNSWAADLVGNALDNSIVTVTYGSIRAALE